MTDQPQNDDKKLLLTIAAVIVTGAAGVALIAGLGGERSDGRTPTVARAPLPSVPDPASTRPEAYELAVHREAPETAFAPVAQDDSAPAATYTFEPGENLVAGGLAAWDARDFARAAAYFEAQVAARDADAWSWYMLGLSRWKAGELDAAAAALRASAERDAAAVKARVNLSRVENDRGDPAAALAAADAALAIAPDEPEALFLRGRSLYNADRIDEAIAALEASIAGDSGNAHAHNLLGLIRIEQGSFDAAADVLEVAAGLAPDVSFIQNNLGMALERVGERDAAITSYRRAVALEPAYANAVANLSRLDPAGVAPDETAAVATGVADAATLEPPVTEPGAAPARPEREAGGLN